MREAYESGFVPSDYVNVYEQIGDENIYCEKSEMQKLSDEQIIAVIAMQFRNDHFCEGILIYKFVAEGLMLHYMRELFQRIETKTLGLEIFINDLLHFSSDEMENIKIKFNQTSPDANPMDLYLKDPEMVNTQ
jgi:hypothetical protein